MADVNWSGSTGCHEFMEESVIPELDFNLPFYFRYVDDVLSYKNLQKFTKPIYTGEMYTLKKDYF